MPVLFGRKERVEDLAQILFRDPDARVKYADGDVFARLRFDIHSRVMLVDLDVLRLDAELPAVRHRVARVDAEVHQHLVKLRRVARYAIQIRVDREGNLDVFRHRIGQDLDDLLYKAPGLQRDVFTLDPAGEREHLFDHLASAHGVCMKDVEQALAAFVIETHLQQLHRGEDRREHVVQVVCDAAGERADALHTLRAQELRFETFLFGDVADDGGE